MTKVLIFALGLCAAIILYLLYLNKYYCKILEKSINLLEESAMKLDQSSKYIHSLKDELAKSKMELEEYKGVR